MSQEQRFGDSSETFWGGIQIQGQEKDAPTCVNDQPHRWDGPTSTGAEGWTLVSATKCTECEAMWMETVRA